MSYLQSMFFGLVQGLTEFLPVSSSGHLVLLQHLFALGDENMLFNVLLHCATLVAVIIAFRDDIAELLRETGRLVRAVFSKDPELRRGSPGRRLLLLLIAATLPLVFVIPLQSLFENMSKMPVLVGIALIVTGLLLFIGDKFSQGRKTERSAQMSDALTVGFMQAIAVMPGLSRSGATIVTGLFRGFDRRFAVKFSFLMSLPAVIAATLLEIVKVFVAAGEPGAVPFDWGQLPVFLSGMLVAGVAGYFAIQAVRYLINRDRFGWFSYYCFAAGIITIIVVLTTKP